MDQTRVGGSRGADHGVRVRQSPGRAHDDGKSAARCVEGDDALPIDGSRRRIRRSGERRHRETSGRGDGRRRRHRAGRAAAGRCGRGAALTCGAPPKSSRAMRAQQIKSRYPPPYRPQPRDNDRRVTPGDAPLITGRHLGIEERARRANPIGSGGIGRAVLEAAHVGWRAVHVPATSMKKHERVARRRRGGVRRRLGRSVGTDRCAAEAAPTSCTRRAPRQAACPHGGGAPR
jgi:hypothetical protein